MNYELWLEQECWDRGDVVRNLQRMKFQMEKTAEGSEAFKKEYTAREFIWGQALLIDKMLSMLEKCKKKEI